MVRLPGRRLAEHVDRLAGPAGLHPDHRERGVRRRQVGREAAGGCELRFRRTELRLQRHQHAALEVQQRGIGTPRQADVDDFDAELQILVVDADVREIDVVLLGVRRDARRGAERVVRLLDVSGPEMRSRREVVQFGRLRPAID